MAINFTKKFFMQYGLVDVLRCPVTRSRLSLTVVKESSREFGEGITSVVEEGILFSEEGWPFPVIAGIPRLCIESFLDYEVFLAKHINQYAVLKEKIFQQYGSFIKRIIKKNKKTRKSFSNEWGVYNFDADKTWEAGDEEMVSRFLEETGETFDSLSGKIIFDAGCGNGKLNCLLGNRGITNIGMDFSNSVELSSKKNRSRNVHFIQGDVQFPPVAFNHFDVMHSSGVLIHTTNTELSFSCLEPLVKPGGKISVWLYHPRKDFLHNFFNFIRGFTSKLPLWFQKPLYWITIFPMSYLVKKIKGTTQNSREMMLGILDWFTPEFRWEHSHEEVFTWFHKRNYDNVTITTNGVFGFNTTGKKKDLH
jgi:2-polyprenyl-3-methyl-5-hydroxy-6-metoxy-1,4-benzoquinol methylase/uncharacterized protein YbaR (Trm112 family)